MEVDFFIQKDKKNLGIGLESLFFYSKRKKTVRGESCFFFPCLQPHPAKPWCGGWLWGKKANLSAFFPATDKLSRTAPVF
jgi:hypothetical protein